MLAKTDVKLIVLGAAMTFIGLATAGVQNGLRLEHIAAFVAGLILITIYHHWFDVDHEKTILLLNSEILELKPEIINLKEEIVSLQATLSKQTPELKSLKLQIVDLKRELAKQAPELKSLKLQIVDLKKELAKQALSDTS